MASDDVREIKSRLDIVEIVSEYVKLKKNGRTYWGCCPFHSEKTPSFSVSPERGTYHCFGCGKGGDIFSFIMEAEHLEFREALERLAERAGVTLSRGGKNAAVARINRDINKAAQEFFRECLSAPGGAAARKYLERRSLTAADCKRFGIGWAPDSWDMLSRALQNKGFTTAQIVESGLAGEGRRGGCYDRFRGRVMFPICNITGRLIGFGGRILEGDGAKYLNSPESRIFNKRHNLYLLDNAKSSMNTKGYAILVEGYLDAIRAHLFGYTNTVASLGTSLTREQASLIKRMTGSCYVCYDADPPGMEASLRAMYILQAEGIQTKRIVWSGGKDPDELLLLPEGREMFDKAIADALPLPLFHARLRSDALKDPAKAADARRDLIEGLSSLSVFDVTPYLTELGEVLDVFPHEVQNILSDYKRRGAASLAATDEVQNTGAHNADDTEYMLCSLLWGSEEFRMEHPPAELLPYIANEEIQAVIFALLNGDTPEDIEKRWRQMNNLSGMEIIARGNSLLSRDGIGLENAEKFLVTLREKYFKNRKDELLKKIKSGNISEKEYGEYLEYTRLLKGGNIKA